MSLGDIDTATELIVSEVKMTQINMLANGEIQLTCGSNRNLFHLHQFGLSIHNETFRGQGLNKEIKLVNGCSLGSMKYKQKEWNLEQQFENDCLGRNNCSLKLDFPQIFDTGCLNELKNRIQGSQDTK